MGNINLKNKIFIAKKSISINDKSFRIVEGEDVELLRTHIKNEKLYVILKNLADNEIEMLYNNFCILFDSAR